MTTVEKFKMLFSKYVDEYKVLSECSLSECEKFAEALKISKQEIQDEQAKYGNKFYDIAIAVVIIRKVKERKY